MIGPLHEFAAAPGTSEVAEARVRELVAEILARPEFRPPARGITEWLSDRLRDLFEWLGDLFDFKGLSGLSIPIQALYALAFLLLVLGVILLVRKLRGAPRAQRSSALSVAAERAARAAQLLAQARQAAQRGERTLAARYYFWALVIGLSERGAIEVRDSWTCREALERGAPAAEIAALLTPLVPRLDALSFGDAPAHAADVDELAALCDRWLMGAPA